MKVTREEPEFKTVVIRLESQLELSFLKEILKVTNEGYKTPKEKFSKDLLDLLSWKLPEYYNRSRIFGYK